VAGQRKLPGAGGNRIAADGGSTGLHLLFPQVSARGFAERKTVRQNLTATAKVNLKPPSPSKILGPPKAPAAATVRTRPIGHQLSVTKPTASVLDELRLGLR